MAAVPGTPRQRVRSAGRPPKRAVSDSAPPLKKRRYIPGGPGGGGRYVDEDGEETPVGGTGPGGYAYIGPRGRVGRMNAEKQGLPLPDVSPSSSYIRPRRERPPAGPRSSSAAAAAAIVAQTDGYKPREERGWEEFHQDLDIEAEFPVFGADLIDGTSPAESTPGTPQDASSTSQFAVDSGASAALDEALRAQQAFQDALKAGGANGTCTTPAKRRVGRPSRKLDSMLSGLGSPPAPRIAPLPTMNPKEKLNLPKPSCRQVDTFKAFEESEGVQVNYVDRTLASIGYQESEVFIKPEKSLIRLPEGSMEEDLDLALKADADGPISAVALSRVEYDMDEQDARWLDQINAQRKEELIEAVRPAVLEVTITQIEKEWHALEKRTYQPFNRGYCIPDELTQLQESPNRIQNLPRRIVIGRTQQLPSMANPQAQAKSRTQSVRFATTGTARTPMPSSFAMDVTWLFIRNAMVCHSYPKDSGSAAAASGWAVGPLPATIR